MRFTIEDSYQYGVIRNCGLYRSGLTVATANSIEPMATFASTSGIPGILRLSTTSISHAMVNNSKFGYWLQCYIQDYGPLYIFGADVSYTIG